MFGLFREHLVEGGKFSLGGLARENALIEISETRIDLRGGFDRLFGEHAGGFYPGDVVECGQGVKRGVG